MSAPANATAVELDERYRTRPGTPMVGPYSVNQMDNFYAALAAGEVKRTGVMNLVQRLYIAERCPPGARVVDVCCGRGLQLPVLYRYAAHIGGYAGLDISPANLAEARQMLALLDDRHGPRRRCAPAAGCSCPPRTRRAGRRGRCSTGCTSTNGTPTS